MIISRPNGDDDYYHHVSCPNHRNDDDDANASIAINATTEIMLPGRIKKSQRLVFGGPDDGDDGRPYDDEDDDGSVESNALLAE